MQSQSPLLASYLERRDDMRRFFLAKLGPDADVEDLVQDLYLKVIALQDEPVNNPPAFLYRLASNLMLDRLRQRRRAGARDADWRSTHQTSVGPVDVTDAPDAESAVIAWMRHQTTAYDSMKIARVKGERRAVRRQLAEISRAVLDLHRGRISHPPSGCPLCKAVE